MKTIRGMERAVSVVQVGTFGSWSLRKGGGIRLALAGVLLMALVALGSAAPAVAQTGGPYDLTWSTVDGGGYTFSTGGNYTLGGTVGQADAGVLSGGAYALVGGFWGAEGAAPSVCEQVTGVTIVGNTTGLPGDYVFAAVIAPSSATPPIAYTWSSNGLVSGQGTANARYTWTTEGVKTISVTASNCHGTGTASDSHTITIATDYRIYLPLVLKDLP